MSRKLPHTPNTRIKAALHKLFLTSRERAATIKRDQYTCQKCHRKQSKAKGKEFKVQCHHKEGVKNWNKLYEAVRTYLLCDPEKMETLCKECHNKEHREE